jgi:hypothetical protein
LFYLTDVVAFAELFADLGSGFDALDFTVLPKRPRAGSTESGVQASVELAMKEKAVTPPTTIASRPSHHRAVAHPGWSVVKAPTVSALPH